MRRPTRLASVLAMLPAVATAAQPPPAPSPQQIPTFRSGVGVVRVDVTVMGRNDEPVADLTAEDFEVREDGVAQTVEWIQFIRVTGAATPGDPTSLAIRSREHAEQEAAREDVRLLVIFLDDYHLRWGPGFDVVLKQTLRRFVEVEMQPTDLFGVMGPLTPISHLRLTRSKQDVIDAIAGLQGQLGGFVLPRSPIEENQFRLNPALRASVRAQVSLSALRALVSYLGGLRDGRKSVLFVSEGPPLYADGLSLNGELRDVIDAANRSNVTIHTLDPRALGARRFGSGANSALAAETGGRELANSNDFTRGLAAVMADSSAYYLLGYTPARDVADGRFHKIEVKVRRRGVRVLARKGYWAPRAEELHARPPDPAPPDVTMAFGALDEGARPREVLDWIGTGPIEDGMREVTIACTQAAAAKRSSSSIATIRVEELDRDGEVTATHAAERAAPDAPWLARFRAAPGPMTLRLVAQDAAGATLDRWTRQVDVAGESDLAGTPIVYRATSVAAYRALLQGRYPPPAVDRRFRRTDRVVVRLPLAVGRQGSGVAASLVNERGQTLVTLPVSSSPEGEPLVELPLANLAHARYALRMTIEHAAVSHLVPFAVVP